ncbi:MAG: glycosyltransferase family 39 protein [Patescibacteria group bacterium]|nr:glycosyltransferase family 39 protein [Patescibacteria group bacterium]
MSRKKEIYFVGGILLLALVLFFTFSSSVVSSSDSALYFKLAENLDKSLKINTTTRLNSLIQPGFPFMIYVYNFYLNNIELASQIVSLISTFLSIIIIYFLAKKLFNFKIAILSIILFILNPYVIWYSGAAWTEALFTFLFISIVLLSWLLLNKEKNTFWYLILGILIGFSYYVRIVGLSFLPVIILWLFINYIYYKRIRLKKLFISLTLLIIGVVMVVSPYLIYLYKEKGQFVITGQQDYAVSSSKSSYFEKNIIFFGLNEENTDYNSNQLEMEKPKKSYIIIYINNFFRNLPHNIAYVICYFIFQIIFIVFAFYFSKKKKYILHKLYFLGSWIPFFLFIYYSGKVYYRYYFPLTPIILMIVAVGIVRLYQSLSFKKKRIVILSILLVFLSFQFVIAIEDGYQFRFFSLFRDTEIKEMSQFFKEKYGSGHKILTNARIIAYWAQGINYILPSNEYEDIIEFARNREIKYLIFNNEKIPYLRPNLKNLYKIKENKDLKLLFEKNGFYFYKIKIN